MQRSGRLSVVYSMLQCEVVCDTSSTPVLQLQYLHQLVLSCLVVSPVLPAARGMLYQRSVRSWDGCIGLWLPHRLPVVLQGLNTG